MSKSGQTFEEIYAEEMGNGEPITEEEKKEFLAFNEAELLKALKGEDDHVEETKTIKIKFRSAQFTFRIRGLSEKEYNECHEMATTYQKNKRLGGMRLPEKTDTVKYHTLLIFKATVDADKAKLWNNKNLWAAVNAVTGTDLVDILIPEAGKKQAIVEQIEKLSGFDDEAEEEYNDTVKN